jgi:hypothetical protein
MVKLLNINIIILHLIYNPDFLALKKPRRDRHQGFEIFKPIAKELLANIILIRPGQSVRPAAYIEVAGNL